MREAVARLFRQVDATMPEHKHGMNYAPTIASRGDGRYRAEGMVGIAGKKLFGDTEPPAEVKAPICFRKKRKSSSITTFLKAHWYLVMLTRPSSKQ